MRDKNEAPVSRKPTRCGGCCQCILSIETLMGKDARKSIMEFPPELRELSASLHLPPNYDAFIECILQEIVRRELL